METGMHIRDVCTRLGSKVSTLGKSIHQLIRVSLRRQKPRSSDVEQWIAEFEPSPVTVALTAGTSIGIRVTSAVNQLRTS